MVSRCRDSRVKKYKLVKSFLFHFLILFSVFSFSSSLVVFPILAAPIPAPARTISPIKVYFQDQENFPVPVDHLAATGELHLSLDVKAGEDFKSPLPELGINDLAQMRSFFFIVGKASALIKGKNPESLNMALLGQRTLLEKAFPKAVVEILSDGQIHYQRKKVNVKRPELGQMKGRIVEVDFGAAASADGEIFYRKSDQELEHKLGPWQKAFVMDINGASTEGKDFGGHVVTKVFKVNEQNSLLVVYYTLKLPMKQASWIPMMDSLIKFMVKSRIKDPLKKVVQALQEAPVA